MADFGFKHTETNDRYTTNWVKHSTICITSHGVYTVHIRIIFIIRRLFQLTTIQPGISTTINLTNTGYNIPKCAYSETLLDQRLLGLESYLIGWDYRSLVTICSYIIIYISRVPGLGLGLDKFLWPRPWPHSLWPRPRPWPRAKLASLTSLDKARY